MGVLRQLQTALMGFAKGATHPALADFAAMANQIRTFRLRQIDPTGKSLLIFRNRVKPRNQKYFASRLTQIRCISFPVSSHSRGVSRSSRTRGGMRWTWAARVTNGADADGEVVSF